MSYKVCFVCIKAYEGDHDCEVAKKMAANPITLDAPFISPDATPTRDSRRSR